MYLYNKFFHPLNFVFGNRYAQGNLTVGSQKVPVKAEGGTDDVYRITFGVNSLAPKSPAPLDLRAFSPLSKACTGALSSLRMGADGSIALLDKSGKSVLTTPKGGAFGTCGEKWMIRFNRAPAMRFFGMGEKVSPIEKSGRSYQFYNADAFCDIPREAIDRADYDPDYISVPYTLIKHGNAYCGVLLDTAYPVQVSLANPVDGVLPPLTMAAEDGSAVVYIIYGPSLRAVTQKLQKLSGGIPIPPLWALGFHQCRWGYRGTEDLKNLANNFKKHKIPCDGLWLDIHYMDGYRVFTFSKEHFKNPKKEIASIVDDGFKVVPIIDPGVKNERGYGVYESGKADIFCKNPGGTEYIGQVWPGDTTFPDFTTAAGRSWWARQVKTFAENNIYGAWLDMNDPSTGSVDPHDMLFNNGKARHKVFHNQYALFMGRASREGFLAAHPDKRPFLICRSGSTGSQQYVANWMGDNVSNYAHLHGSLGKVLNLSLSGFPISAPDVGGFAGDTTNQLFIDWTKACFLFPFMRDHTCIDTRAQEPWAMGAKVLNISRDYIRMRYKLIPYLYNLYVECAKAGDPILRPLFYEFEDSAKLKLETIDDQFMVGSAIMQAPFTKENQTSRSVVLPPGIWYDAAAGVWIAGNKKVTVKKSDALTPLYVRDGSLVPMLTGVNEDNRKDLRSIELLVALAPKGAQSATAACHADDGESFGFEKGARTSCTIAARAAKDHLFINVIATSKGYGEIKIAPITLTEFSSCTLSAFGKTVELTAKKATMRLFGKNTIVWKWK